MAYLEKNYSYQIKRKKSSTTFFTNSCLFNVEMYFFIRVLT